MDKTRNMLRQPLAWTRSMTAFRWTQRVNKIIPASSPFTRTAAAVAKLFA